MHNQKNRDDAFLKALACRYEIADGERLMREAESLPAQARPPRKRRPGFAIGFGSLAAACLLFLVIGLVRGQNDMNLFAEATDAPWTTEAAA